MESMKRRLFPVAILVVAGIVVAGLAWVPESNQPEPLTHEQAMERWPDLVRNRFKGERTEVARVFYRCFRKGDLASDYEAPLATAGKSEFPDSKTVLYMWGWGLGHGGEGDFVFQVTVEGSPPTITWVNIGEWCR